MTTSVHVLYNYLSNLPNLSLQVTHNYENFKNINNNEKKIHSRQYVVESNLFNYNFFFYLVGGWGGVVLAKHNLQSTPKG